MTIRRHASHLALGLCLGLSTAGCIRVAKWAPTSPTMAKASPNSRRDVDRFRVTFHDGSVQVGWLASVSDEGIRFDSTKRGEAHVDVPTYTWDEIATLEFRDENRQATVGVTATVWTLIGVGAVVGLVFALKGSCPFIYATDDDGRDVLLGECYSGAVGRVLQRGERLRVPTPTHGGIDLVSPTKLRRTNAPTRPGSSSSTNLRAPRPLPPTTHAPSCWVQPTRPPRPTTSRAVTSWPMWRPQTASPW